jgi:hypothetical protein
MKTIRNKYKQQDANALLKSLSEVETSLLRLKAATEQDDKVRAKQYVARYEIAVIKSRLRSLRQSLS